MTIDDYIYVNMQSNVFNTKRDIETVTFSAFEENCYMSKPIYAEVRNIALAYMSLTLAYRYWKRIRLIHSSANVQCMKRNYLSSKMK
jgi:hypothetical protein